jgi:HAMP domain-containing protein
MNLLWMLSLWLQLRGLRRADPQLQFLSGIALGCVFGFSIKIVFVAFSAGLVFAAASWLQRRIPWKPVLSYACGFALPVVATLTFLWSSGMLRAFFDAYIGANVSRDHELTLRWFGRAYREYPFWMTMVTVGIVRPAWRIMRHRAEDAEFILLPVAAFLLFQFFFLLPTHNEQSLLPVQGPAALLVALAFWDWANTGFLKKNARLATAVLAVAVIASAWAGWRLTTRHFLARNPLAMQVAAGNRLMELSAPGDYVLSGAGPPLFRRKPLYHHSLVNHVRHQHVIGALDLQIPAALERNAVRLVVCDARIAALRDSDREYIAAHYQPLEEKLIDTAYVMVAGGTAAVNGTSATVDVRVPAEYRFETLPVRGGIRQVAATSGTVVRLEPGPHSVTTVDGVTTVVFAAAPIDLLAIDEITPGFSLPTGDMAKALRKLSTRSPDKSRKR